MAIETLPQGRRKAGARKAELHKASIGAQLPANATVVQLAMAKPLIKEFSELAVVAAIGILNDAILRCTNNGKLSVRFALGLLVDQPDYPENATATILTHVKRAQQLRGELNAKIYQFQPKSKAPSRRCVGVKHV